jgi:hypothetical protein
MFTSPTLYTVLLMSIVGLHVELLNISKWDAQFKESDTDTTTRTVITVRINTVMVTIYKFQSARYINHYEKQTKLCFHKRTYNTHCQGVAILHH